SVLRIRHTRRGICAGRKNSGGRIPCEDREAVRGTFRPAQACPERSRTRLLKSRLPPEWKVVSVRRGGCGDSWFVRRRCGLLQRPGISKPSECLFTGRHESG